MANSSKSRENSNSHAHAPTYLYRKGNIYYFRYALPKHLKKSFGGVEIQLSLRTPYIREASMLAAKLHEAISALLQGKTMLSLQEIKKRLAAYLTHLVELQAGTFELLENDPLYEMPKGENSAAVFRDKQRLLYSDSNLQQALYKEWAADKCYSPLSDSVDEKKYSEITGKPFKSEHFFAMYAERRSAYLVKNGYFTATEIEENKAMVGKALMQAGMLFNDYVVKDESGNVLAAQKLIADYVAAAGSQAAQVAQSAPEVLPAPAQNAGATAKQLPYTDAVARYIAVKLQSNEWKEHNVKDIRNRLDFFTDIVGNKPIQSITRDDMRSFVEILRQLPPNRTKYKKYAGKSASEIIAMKPEQVLNVTTVNTVVEAVGSLLEWYVREGVLMHNPAKALQIKDDRQAIELREAFTIPELAKIFAHPKFAQGKFKFPAYFWLPLIGLFSGMRLEEIAQLHCADIRKVGESDLWIFDVNEVGLDEQGFKKSLKNKNARRQVSIHKTLVELGLLDYHAKVAKGKNIRLFPELTKSDNTSKYGKQPSKQFSAVVNAVLENPEKKSFHSLRHTFADFYKQRGWQTDIFRQLYGHEIPELASKQYGSKFPPELLYREVIEKLDYGLDLSGLMNSKHRSPAKNEEEKASEPQTKNSKGNAPRRRQKRLSRSTET